MSNGNGSAPKSSSDDEGVWALLTMGAGHRVLGRFMDVTLDDQGEPMLAGQRFLEIPDGYITLDQAFEFAVVPMPGTKLLGVVCSPYGLGHDTKIPIVVRIDNILSIGFVHRWPQKTRTWIASLIAQGRKQAQIMAASNAGLSL